MGALWVVLQPLALMAIFSIFLSKIARGGTGGIPYPLYLYAGLTFWGYFAAMINTISNSVVGSAGIITKIYFPRIIPALASALVASVDFLVSFAVFIALFLVFKTIPNLLGFLIFPLLMAIAASAAIGFGLFFAALNVRYRDVKQALPFIVQAWFFMTPIIYPFSIVPEKLQTILFLNPMVGVVNTARSAFFTGGIDSWPSLLVATGVSLLMLAGGTAFFFRKEPTFVDTV